jgi:hypothetical protein
VLSAHPGQVAGAATNNAERAAHQSERPTHPRLPPEAPVPGETILTAEPDAVSCRDNAFVYVHGRRFKQILAGVGAKHIRIPKSTPRWNGKVERFIQTLQNEWAYARLWPTSHQRARALPSFIRYYNRYRPHSALEGLPPISRVHNLRGQDT